MLLRFKNQIINTQNLVHAGYQEKRRLITLSFASTNQSGGFKQITLKNDEAEAFWNALCDEAVDVQGDSDDFEDSDE